MFPVPPPPGGVSVAPENATPTSVSFSWNSPVASPNEFDSYRITYNIGDGPILANIFLANVVNQYVLEDLFPATDYNIYLATSSGNGLLRTISEPAIAVATTCKFSLCVTSKSHPVNQACNFSKVFLISEFFTNLPLPQNVLERREIYTEEGKK